MSPERGRWLIVSETAAVPRRTVLLARTLAAEVDLDVLCWSRRGIDQTPVELEKWVILSRSRRLVGLVLELAELLRRYSYSGIVLADLRLLTLALPLLAGSGARVIYDRMEIPSVTLANRLRALTRVSEDRALHWAEVLERMVAARVHAVLTVPVEGRALQHVRSLNERILTLSNWPSLHEVVEGGTDSGSGDRFTAVHAGAVSRATGLGTILDAAQVLQKAVGPPIHFLLVGYPVEDDVTSLEREIARRGLDGTVHVMARVPFADLPPILRGADVGLALLDPEDPKYRWVGRGMSRKPFTYMCYGLPVVASAPQGSWVARDGVGLTVPFGQPDALVGALTRLRDDPPLCARFGETGRKRILDVEHWEAQAPALRAFIINTRRP